MSVHDEAAIIAGLVKRIAALERAESKPVIVRSPDGTRWRIEVSNAGVVSAVLA
jgi:hypothetical protein